MGHNIYGLLANCGDGSYTLRWFRNKELVDTLLSEDDEYMYESDPEITLTFSKYMDWDEIEAIGFSFSDDDY
jgi:hypothetical protein